MKIKKTYIAYAEGECVDCIKYPCDFLKNYIDPRKEKVKYCKHKKKETKKK